MQPRLALLALGLLLVLASSAAGQNVPLVFIGDGGTPYVVTEGVGMKTVTIPVTLNEGSSTQVTVDWHTQSAWFRHQASDSGFRIDYQAAGGTVVFAPGETSKTVSVSILDDAIAEQDESFVVTLSNPVGADIGLPEDFWTHGAVVTIHDNELGVFIGDGGYTLGAPEGDNGTTPFEVPVTLNFASTAPVTAHWTTREPLVNDPRDAATADQDYQAASGTVTFAPGETEKSVPIQIIGDTLSESPEEEFLVSLTDVDGAQIGVPWDDVGLGAIVGIQDDDPADISINDVTVTEGDSGTTNATFTLTRSSFGNDRYPNPVTVDWVAEGVTAQAGADFVAASGTVTFGGLKATIDVPVVGDTAAEGNETFEITLSNPQNAVIADAGGIGTIVDDDDQPTHGTLTVSTKVINDDGGTLAAGDFTMTILTDDPVPVTFPGVAPPGHTVSLNPGNYQVGAIPHGYTITFAGECGGIIAAGESRACTITADDRPTRGTLTVIANVINDNGGTLTASDFTITMDPGSNASPASFAGAAAPGTTVTLDPGIYALSIRGKPGYVITNFSPDCSGTIAAGDHKTCTITADDTASDTVPPAITCGSSDGAWHGANVSIPCAAHDDRSGLANPADAAFSLSTSVLLGAEDANAATASRRVCDMAGNCATAGPIGGNKIDRKGPTLSVPGDKTVDATSPSGAIVTFTASATDGADPHPGMACTPASGSQFVIGTTTVACTATDDVGNTSTGSFKVTVAGAKEQLNRLIQKVVGASTLSPTAKTQLTGSLQSFVGAFDPTNAAQRQAVCTALRTFIAAVQLLSPWIPPALAAEWIADASRIRAVLGC